MNSEGREPRRRGRLQDLDPDQDQDLQGGGVVLDLDRDGELLPALPLGGVTTTMMLRKDRCPR